jgi:hypothetical protein
MLVIVLKILHKKIRRIAINTMRKFQVISALFTVVMSCVIQTTTHAASITINNPGFESYAIPDNTYTTSGTGLTGYGWTVYSASPGTYIGVWNPTNTHFPTGVPEGVNVAYSHGDDISQTLSETLTAGITYSLQVDIGTRNTPVARHSVVIQCSC